MAEMLPIQRKTLSNQSMNLNIIKGRLVMILVMILSKLAMSTECTEGKLG